MTGSESDRNSAGLLSADICDTVEGCPDGGERHEMPTTHTGDPLLHDAVSAAVQDISVQDHMDMTMPGDAWLDFDWSNFFSDIPMLSTEGDLPFTSGASITDAAGAPLLNSPQPLPNPAVGQLAGTEAAGSNGSLGAETPEDQQAHRIPTTSDKSSPTSSLESLSESTESQSPSEDRTSRKPKGSLSYQTAIAAPAPWGSKTHSGQQLFSYTPKGQWLLDRCFDKEQLREYASSCPPETIFWLQQAPTKCGDRLDPEDRVCRWAGCPVFNRRITAGWLRVAFDETPALTSDGTRDPLKVAGAMHLWCFEQVLDPLEFHLSGRLRPEARQFPREDRSVVTLEKSTDAGIVREAYLPWMEGRAREWHATGPSGWPRPHEESLSFAMNRYHLDNQTAARQRARLRRNAHKAEAERRTIDVHQGDLGLFTWACRKAKDSRKCRRLDGELASTAGSDQELCSSISHERPQMPSPSCGQLVCSGQSFRERPYEWSEADQQAWAPRRLMPDSARAVSGSPSAVQARASASGRHPRGYHAGDSPRSAIVSSSTRSREGVAAAESTRVACSVAQRGVKRLREVQTCKSLDLLEEQRQLPAKRQRLADGTNVLGVFLDDEYLAQLNENLNQDPAPQLYGPRPQLDRKICQQSDVFLEQGSTAPPPPSGQASPGSDEAEVHAQVDKTVPDLWNAGLFGAESLETMQQGLLENLSFMSDDELASISLWGLEGATSTELLDDAVWPSEQIDSQFWMDQDLQGFFAAQHLGGFGALDFLADVGTGEAGPDSGGQDSEA